MAVRAVKTLHTFPPPTVANVTLNPHQSERSPLALLPPSPDQNPIQAIPHSHSPTPSESEFTKASATVTRLGQEKD